MSKTVLWIVFSIGCALQWAAPLMQISGHEKVIEKGELISFRCNAPDPYDMLRGRYLAVRASPDNFQTPSDAKILPGETLFALVAPGQDGLAEIKSLTRERPAARTYIKVACQWASGTSTTIVWPFDRFYLNEKIAPKADEWYLKNIRNEKPVTAEVRVLDGRAVLVDLKQDGKSFRTMLSDMPESN